VGNLLLQIERAHMAFRFLEPGPMIDRELELVTPHERWIDATLQTCRHVLCVGDERCDNTTRGSLMDFLQAAPRGRQDGDGKSRVPSYSFWMRLLPQYDPPVPIAGGSSIRIGHSRDVEMYFGHIGYHVYPAARGHHYAERACRLLLPLAAAHGMQTLWITTNPDNVPSRRTCERLGATLAEIVDVPPTNVLHQRGEVRKCRYRIDLLSG
jgi:tagatose 1,6-diphosphate aldolase